VGAILVGVGSPVGAVAGSAPLEIRIVVVTTFPQGYRSLRYNAKDHVLGSQPAPAGPVPAASIMVLGLDPRFDLSQAHWISDGIATINPNRASVRSAAWASPIVDAIWPMKSMGARFQPTGRPSCPTTERHFRAAGLRRPPPTMAFWPTI
jgi:purine nucleoside permease